MIPVLGACLSIARGLSAKGWLPRCAVRRRRRRPSDAGRAHVGRRRRLSRVGRRIFARAHRRSDRREHRLAQQRHALPRRVEEQTARRSLELSPRTRRRPRSAVRLRIDRHPRGAAGARHRRQSHHHRAGHGSDLRDARRLPLYRGLAVAAAPEDSGTYRIEARGFCTQPAHAVRGDGEVLVSTFEFAGPVTFETPPDTTAGATP